MEHLVPIQERVRAEGTYDKNRAMQLKTSDSEQIWCRAPSFAPEDSVFAQIANNQRKKR